MTKDLDWLLLQSALGQGAMLKPLIEAYGGAKEILSMTEAQRMAGGLFTPRQSAKLDRPDVHTAEKIINACRQSGWRICTYEDADFPSALREIPNPPAVLFCNGTLPDFENRLSIGMVGARDATKYALRATDYLSYVMARCGAIIVSGGAMGVDSASHRAALRAEGTTVAVLGCGFGTNYLMQYEPMRQAIANSGAVITEYPPYTEVSRSSFPLRNRLISALSDGVVVVEAAVKSGSLITAKRAGEQGKDVFAVPGSIVSQVYAGTNHLLEDGAIPALSPDQILRFYTSRYPTIDFSGLLDLPGWQETLAKPATNTPASGQQNASFELDRPEREQAATRAVAAAVESLPAELCTIYNSLTEAYQHIDIIIKKTGLAGPAVVSGLTRLEVMGLVKTASGKRYRKDEAVCQN